MHSASGYPDKTHIVLTGPKQCMVQSSFHANAPCHALIMMHLTSNLVSDRPCSVKH